MVTDIKLEIIQVEVNRDGVVCHPSFFVRVETDEIDEETGDTVSYGQYFDRNGAKI